MQAALAWHEHFLDHVPPAGHPERTQRLTALIDALDAAGLRQKLTPLDFNPAPLEALRRVHDPLYIDQLRDAFADGVRQLDPDTHLSEHSYDVARLASGAALAAADAIVAGDITRAFCALRPPGHHAEHDRAMGFCLFNHIAVAAQHLTRHHGLERVAIVDFDVHHGNGTQHSFESRADVFYISIHQDPRKIFPGTGFADETGRGEGEGFTLNLPMPPGADDAAYRDAFTQRILPRLRNFQPECLLLSAGFDAAAEDPLGQVALSDDAFGWITRQLVEIAEEFAGGRVLSLLEGGYDLQALGRCGVAHVKALL